MQMNTTANRLADDGIDVDEATLALASAIAQLDLLRNYFEDMDPETKAYLSYLGLRKNTLELMIHSITERVDTAMDALSSNIELPVHSPAADAAVLAMAQILAGRDAQEAA